MEETRERTDGKERKERNKKMRKKRDWANDPNQANTRTGGDENKKQRERERAYNFKERVYLCVCVSVCLDGVVCSKRRTVNSEQ